MADDGPPFIPLLVLLMLLFKRRNKKRRYTGMWRKTRMTFNLEDYSDLQCNFFFRFLIHAFLDLPSTMKLRDGSRVPSLEALCIMSCAVGSLCPAVWRRRSACLKGGFVF